MYNYGEDNFIYTAYPQSLTFNKYLWFKVIQYKLHFRFYEGTCTCINLVHKSGTEGNTDGQVDILIFLEVGGVVREQLGLEVQKKITLS